MNLKLDQNLLGDYKSSSQRIRVLTESWVGKEGYCPNCGCHLNHFPNSQPVADFYCRDCKEEYELKSKKGSIGDKIVDGAYSTMLERLKSLNNPSFFFLNYSAISWRVLNFFVIPKHFFSADIIERRNPLSVTARRSNWVGCNILLSSVPTSGKIYFIKNGEIEARDKVSAEWHRTLFLRESLGVEARGWALAVMKCIDRLGRADFLLDDVYAFEKELKQAYPDNKHIKDKIRQQLQILRDKGYLEFIGRGKYRLIRVDHKRSRIGVAFS